MEPKSDRIILVVASSSGLGRLVLIQEIAGSTPAATTIFCLISQFFCPAGDFFFAFFFPSFDSGNIESVAYDIGGRLFSF